MALMMTIIVWAAISLLLLHSKVEYWFKFILIKAGAAFLLFWAIVNGLKLLV